jgi:hypothetical protein
MYATRVTINLLRNLYMPIVFEKNIYFISVQI